MGNTNTQFTSQSPKAATNDFIAILKKKIDASGSRLLLQSKVKTAIHSAGEAAKAKMPDQKGATDHEMWKRLAEDVCAQVDTWKDSASRANNSRKFKIGKHNGDANLSKYPPSLDDILAYMEAHALAGGDSGLEPWCCEPCPTCKAPCTKSRGHTTRGEAKHNCSFHQPLALKGTIYKNSHKLSDDAACHLQTGKAWLCGKEGEEIRVWLEIAGALPKEAAAKDKRYTEHYKSWTNPSGGKMDDIPEVFDLYAYMCNRHQKDIVEFHNRDDREVLENDKLHFVPKISSNIGTIKTKLQDKLENMDPQARPD